MYQHFIEGLQRLGRALMLPIAILPIAGLLLRLEALAKQGVKKLLVMCPAFVADCIETLEEIGDRGLEQFREAGGEELVLVPCLNDDPQWAKALNTLCERAPTTL